MTSPRSSGYFRTRYEDDLALIDTRTQKVWLGVLAVVLVALPFVANALVLDLANQVLLVSIGAVALMLLTGFAGQISLGHAGLLAAGAFTTGILFKEFAAPFWVTLPASRRGRCADRPCVRPAQPAPARPVSRGVDAGAALHGDPRRPGVRNAARAQHRRRDRSAVVRRLHAAGRARLVLRAARRVGGHRAAEPQSAAQRRPAAPGVRSTAARRWPRRWASTCRSPSCRPSSCRAR